MAILFAAAGTLCAICAIIAAHVTVRVARSNPAVYNTNRVITGDFRRAAAGLISPLINGATDFRVAHFIEPRVDSSGSVKWERAGSLSDEAVDGVLTRQR